MDYLKRQIKLWKFTQILKRLFNDPNLATNKLPKNILLSKVKDNFFSKADPFNDKENSTVFPVAISQFNQAIENGHNPTSIKKLDFLDREFIDYFSELQQEKVLLSDSDNPPSYFLNHKSPKVYWVLGFMAATAFIWGIFKMFKGDE